MNNTCVCCGKVIPEGRQICPTCGDITNKNFKSNNSEIMRNKQVEELAAYLSQFTPILSENNCHHVAEQAYKDGYHKQSEGEWVMQRFPLTQCSVCKTMRNCETEIGWNFCPNCGANMKGGAE
jgi:predicted nucleic acid-binding Zn ribbon protein